MRVTAAALLALIGFAAAAVLGWARGMSMDATLGRALLALLVFGGLGYGLGLVGERIIREVLEKKEARAAPPAGVPAPAPAAAAKAEEARS